MKNEGETSERDARREVQEAVVANAQFRIFFEEVANFAVLLDMAGVVIDANRTSLESSGFTREQIIGRSLWECGWFSPLPSLVKVVQDAVQMASTGKIFREELNYFHADRAEHFVDLTITPTRNSEGHIAFLVLSGIDTTSVRLAKAQFSGRSRLADLRSDISSALISGQTGHDIQQKCAEALVKHLDAAFARIWTLNATDNVLELQASAGLYTHIDGPHGRVKVGEYKIGRIAQNAHALLTNDVQHDPNISDPAWAKREGMIAFAGYPMILEDRVYGVVALFARHTLSDDVFRELDGLVANIAQWVKRKQTEELLRDTKSRLESTLAASEVATWTWDVKQNRVFADANLARMFSVNVQDAAGGPIEKYFVAVHPDDRVRVQDTISRVLESQSGHYEMDYRLCLPDGAVRWIAARGKVERDAHGDPIRFPGVVFDITERKQTEEALRNSEERFRLLADNMSQFAWIADAEGSIFWYNQRWFDYTGTTLESMVGWGWGKVHHPDHLSRVAEKWKQHLQQGSEWEDTFPLLGKDGNYRWFLSRAFPIRDDQKKIVRWFGTNTDITDVRTAHDALREAQDALAEQNRILDQTVQQRTAKLQETIQELESFSYSISHDMRSPLRAMQGYAQALLEDYGDRLEPEAHHYLERIHRGATRLDLLVRDVLAYSQVARGTVQMQKINLQTVINDIVQNYPNLHASLVEVETSDLPMVEAHEGLLTQIFSNLIGNAIKFARPGVPPTVKISAETRGAEVRVFVQDNGIGIAPQHQSQIFDIFGRVYPEKQYEGTGIGLAIVRKAAERMGGSSGVTSVMGEGSRFWITLKHAE